MLVSAFQPRTQLHKKLWPSIDVGIIQLTRICHVSSHKVIISIQQVLKPLTSCHCHRNHHHYRWMALRRNHLCLLMQLYTFGKFCRYYCRCCRQNCQLCVLIFLQVQVAVLCFRLACVMSCTNISTNQVVQDCTKGS